MNKIMTIALISAILTAGAMTASAETATVTNVIASWHSPSSGGVFDEYDVSFVSTVGHQGVGFVRDGQNVGNSHVYGKERFMFTSGGYIDTRLTHTVCVNGVCATLQPK